MCVTEKLRMKKAFGEVQDKIKKNNIRLRDPYQHTFCPSSETTKIWIQREFADVGHRTKGLQIL